MINREKFALPGRRRGSMQVKLITYAPRRRYVSRGCQWKCEIWPVVKVHALIDGRRPMSLLIDCSYILRMVVVGVSTGDECNLYGGGGGGNIE